MALVTLSTFTAGTAALASAVNANFDAIKTAVNGGLDAANLAALAVTEGKLADLAVATGKIANLAVTEGKIGAAAVTDAKIFAVAAAKITGTVATAQIADAAVTDVKIASGVDAAKITIGTLPIARIADAAVTSAKLRDSAALSVLGRSANSVGVPADMAAGTDGHVLRRAGTALGFGTIVAAGIADAAVTNVKIASGVDAAKLTTGTLPIARIADAAVTGAKIADAAVTVGKLGSESVTPVKTSFMKSNGGAAGIFAGHILSDGAVGRLPSGWSAVRNSTGDYTITHNLGGTSYIFVGNSVTLSAIVRSVSRGTITLRYETRDITNAPMNTGVYFVLIAHD